MKNDYNIDTLTSVDIQESVKIVGKLIEYFEGVIYRKNFKLSPFEKVLTNYLFQDKKLTTKILIQCKD